METIGTDNPFTAAQERAVVAFAAALIPASEEYNVPSAGDAAIAREVLAAAKRAPAAVAAAVKALDEAAVAAHGVGFAELNDATRVRLLGLGQSNPPASRGDMNRAFDLSAQAGQRTLVSIVAQCYYRDDRVLRSLGMEPRPPFPKGFEVEQGDWSLLEPVKRRGKLYREVGG